jgi:hypothetical protein
MTLNIVFTKLNVVFDIGPSLSSLGGTFMGTVQDFIDDVKAQLADLKATAASEHDQVMAAIAALQEAVGDVIPPTAQAEVDQLFTETKAAITGVYEPTP